MTDADLQAFFVHEGVIATVSVDEGNAVAYIRHRGVPFRVTSYADGTNLLVIECPYTPPTDTTMGDLQRAADETMGNYPIVRFRCFEEQDRPGFVVYGEAFEVVPQALSKPFWQLLDLVLQAGEACYERLGTGTSAQTQASSSAPSFQTKLETLLQAGCPADGAASAPDRAPKRSVASDVMAGLALIADESSTATAFCFAANAEGAFYLTSAHAVTENVPITLYRQWPAYGRYEAVVVAKGEGDREDIAILRVDAHDAVPLELGAELPLEGDPVALAGFPKIQFDIADEYGELRPSFHQGSVSTLVNNGAVVLHDALSRPGNSGGPLFDAQSGKVVGVVQGGWERDGEYVAIGIANVVLPFLEKHGLLTGINREVLA